MPPQSPPRRAPSVATAPQQVRPVSTGPSMMDAHEDGYRIVINGQPGVGKTSLAAFAPNPLIVMCGLETGYRALSRAGLAPRLDSVHVRTWEDARTAAKQANGYQTIVFDALMGLDAMCRDYVCRTQFDGKVSDFESYGKGTDRMCLAWLDFLGILEEHALNGTHIIVLSHPAIKSFKNPLGDAFDRYAADCNPKIWAETKKWCNALLFYAFDTTTTQDKQKRVRGVGGTRRVIYTQHCDAYDAKNLWSMDPVLLDVPESPEAVWPWLVSEIEKNQPARQ